MKLTINITKHQFDALDQLVQEGIESVDRAMTEDWVDYSPGDRRIAKAKAKRATRAIENIAEAFLNHRT